MKVKRLSFMPTLWLALSLSLRWYPCVWDVSWKHVAKCVFRLSQKEVVDNKIKGSHPHSWRLEKRTFDPPFSKFRSTYLRDSPYTQISLFWWQVDNVLTIIKTLHSRFVFQDVELSNVMWTLHDVQGMAIDGFLWSCFLWWYTLSVPKCIFILFMFVLESYLLLSKIYSFEVDNLILRQ